MILSQTNKEQGYGIAERIRQKIEKHHFSTIPANHHHDLKVTVSIGLATFPDDAKTNEDLIAMADKAMYIAKFSGKNQTCLAQ